MKNYLVSYKSKGGNIAISFYKVKANNQSDAIKKAKELFINDWYEGLAKGKTVVKRMTFYI